MSRRAGVFHPAVWWEWATRLHPGALFFGPVFQAEVRAQGRKPSLYWARLIYVIVMFLFVLLFFLGARSGSFMTSSAQRLQQQQVVAPAIAVGLAWFQYIMLALIAPSLTAPAICDERRKRTLPALMTTPLIAPQIVFGKLTSRMLLVVIFALIPAPLLLAVRVFGGLDAGLILAITAIVLSTAILGASLGLLFSAWHRRSSTATMFAYLGVALVQLGPFMVELMPVLWSNRVPGFTMVLTSSPIVLAFVSTEALGEGLPPGLPLSVTQLWQINTAYNLVMAGVFLLLTTVALRRAMNAIGEGDVRTDVADEPATDTAGLEADPDPVVDGSEGAVVDDGRPARRAKKVGTSRDARSIGVSPVLWREMRQPLFPTRGKLSVALTSVICILVFLYARVGLHESGLHGAIAVIGVLAVLFQSALLTTNGISGEREAATLEALLSTPMTPHAILFGKFAGALRRQWFLPTVVMVHFLIAAIAGWLHPLALVHFVIIIAGPMVFLTATGLVLSLRLKKTSFASATNMGIAVVLWFGSIVVLGICAGVLNWDGNGFFDNLTHVVFAFNPVAMMVTSIMTNALDLQYEPVRLSYEFPPNGADVGPVVFLLALVAICCVYLTAAAVVFQYGRTSFNRALGRPS